VADQPNGDELAPDEVQALLDQTLQPDGGRIASRGAIAEGGMGIIEAVDDCSLGRRAAMKVMREPLRSEPAAIRAFIREAQITSQLSHPNVVPVHELRASPDGRLCLVMQLVEGQSLAQIIEQLPPGPLAREALLDLIDVVLRVCDALAYAHSRGVVHGDVKPDNVMVGEHGRVYLMDWGVAQMTEAAAEAAAKVRCSLDLEDEPEHRGTPAYMAPEQAAGGAVDARTDVFAVGALLYAILCRRPPILVSNQRMALRMAKKADFPPPTHLVPGIPPELGRIVVKSMAREPDRRYGSLDELGRDLVRFVRGEAVFPKVEFAAGQAIVRQGEAGDAAYIIEQGRCEVVKEVDGQAIPVCQIGPGEVFGETAILADTPRTATVVALEPTVAFKVAREVLEQELVAMKPWMSAFIRAVAERFSKAVAPNGPNGGSGGGNGGDEG